MIDSVPSGLTLFVREDVRDTVRERQLHVLVGVFVGLALLITYNVGRSDPNSTAGVIQQLFAVFSLLTPLLALGFFASTIVEKRTGGALTVVLGLPIDRETVVIGTFLGRSAVLCAAVFSSLVAAVSLGLVLGVSVEPVRVLAVALFLALFGVTFTALAVGISAVARTTTRATAAAIGAFAVFFFQLWAQLPRGVLYVRHGFSFPATTPQWVAVVEAVNPVAAYSYLVIGLVPDFQDGMFVRTPSEPGFYQEPEFAFAVLVAWIVASIGVGTWRFRATDL